MATKKILNAYKNANRDAVVESDDPQALIMLLLDELLRAMRDAASEVSQHQRVQVAVGALAPRRISGGLQPCGSRLIEPDVGGQTALQARAVIRPFAAVHEAFVASVPRRDEEGVAYRLCLWRRAAHHTREPVVTVSACDRVAASMPAR